jgi:hypothetical protein
MYFINPITKCMICKFVIFEKLGECSRYFMSSLLLLATLTVRSRIVSNKPGIHGSEYIVASVDKWWSDQ